ncbi:MAG: acetyl/propionyl/methylcrotonyl-CoA carboxylase subunit alpha [Alphaproteobacteria bacterium]|nr:acetyl/propionyl/methylcrotonyl-CoA carboxylase subunit alpha [Alphaproteobacteria bacterium]
MFTKILVANRGEIACRVIRTARRNAITTVAVYSDADRNALHVRRADEARHIGGAAASDSYLCGDILLEAAKKSGAEAIHPGYGFLSENADFAAACAEAGIIFIGPSAGCIRAMGLKGRAKDIMQQAGVPVVPGYQGADQTPKELSRQAEKIGYPLLIKAVAGGGGKGMRLVAAAADFRSSLASCKREATASFGNADILLEKYLTRARHIEIQVFGDNYGNAVHLYERDCSVQRRHQKVVEEAPAPGLSDQMRAAMGRAAVAAAQAIGYSGAGTVEFIVDVAHGLDKAPFYFMEMNTRLQVEHPVTEMITELDLVEWQLRVAAGEKLPLSQDEIPLHGHAIEVRLYAEDPENNFMPQSGRISHFSAPAPDRHFRLETGVETGDEVSIHYDPMIAKLIVWDRDRDGALRQMANALASTAVAGLRCNLAFLGRIIRHPAFAHADLDTGFIDRFGGDLTAVSPPADNIMLVLAALAELEPSRTGSDPWDFCHGWRLNMRLKTTLVFIIRDQQHEVVATYVDNGLRLAIDGQAFAVEEFRYDGVRIDLAVNGTRITAKVIKDGQDFTIFHDRAVAYLHHYLPGAEGEGETTGSGIIITPMPGKVSAVMVQNGDEVTAGTPLMILEAMKMEHTIKAGLDGTVADLSLNAGDQVDDGATLVRIIATEDP